VSAQDDPEAFAKAHGFADAAELFRMSGGLDYSRASTIFAYEMWKEYDGSKAGLLKLLESQQKKL
jgi:hypothetical protein